jgi:hypothetical protein
MAVRAWAAGVTWSLEIAKNEARKGKEMYAHRHGKTPKDQRSAQLYKHLLLSDLHHAYPVLTQTQPDPL